MDMPTHSCWVRLVVRSLVGANPLPTLGWSENLVFLHSVVQEHTDDTVCSHVHLSSRHRGFLLIHPKSFFSFLSLDA